MLKLQKKRVLNPVLARNFNLLELSMKVWLLLSLWDFIISLRLELRTHEKIKNKKKLDLDTFFIIKNYYEDVMKGITELLRYFNNIKKIWSSTVEIMQKEK
jgi:hypothetical protein